MSRRNDHTARVVASVLGLCLAAGLLSGCGKQGSLVQPPPLFGERARADYNAQRARDAAAAAPAGAGSTAAAKQDQDNTPATTRDVRDPSQTLTPASRSPVPGAPDPFGAPANPSPGF